MKKQLSDKLAASVREAKKQQLAAPSQEPQRVEEKKEIETTPEPTMKFIPSRRVWPD